jgi:sugar phosphate isomerase/epimerase
MEIINSKIVCTYLYAISKYGYPPRAENTLDYIDEMTSLGFTSIELEGIRAEHLTKVYSLKNEIKRKLISENIQLPYFCAVLPGLTSLNSKEQESNFALLRKGCEIAKLFNAKGVLDNAPLPPYQFADDIPVTRHYDENVLASAALPKNKSWEYLWNHIVDAYKHICDIAAEYDLTYQLHPAVGVLSSNTDGFLNLFNAVNKDNLRFNFDTANQFVQKENLNLALKRLAGFIDYIHISDNRGIKVEHLKLGDGEINWEMFFETLCQIDFDGYIGIDIGGAESEVNDLDIAYSEAAKFITNNWKKLTV